MEITEEILLKNGFEKKYCELTDQYWLEKLVEYKDYPDRTFFLEISDTTNMIGRKWYVHVDNDDCCTVGSVEFNTTTQFNAFMDILDIGFKMKHFGFSCVRKNKRHENRKLSFYEDDKHLADVSRYDGWILYSKFLEKEKHIQVRQTVLDNLYWLLGEDQERDAWEKTVTKFGNEGYLNGKDEIDKAIQSFNN